MTSLVRVEGVRRDYRVGAEVVHAVRGVDLSIDAGESVAIVGPSGCGKSTLLNLLGAIDTPSAGRVLVKGRDVSALGDREATRFRLMEVGFVFQRFYLVPALTARENIELPMAEAGVDKADRRKRAMELLGYVGLAGRERHRPAQLSGGEQQRVAIARALANHPVLLLADELFVARLDQQRFTDGQQDDHHAYTKAVSDEKKRRAERPMREMTQRQKPDHAEASQGALSPSRADSKRTVSSPRRASHTSAHGP